MKRLVCVFKGHDWVYGRAAESAAKTELGWKLFHNRICAMCGKEERHADKADKELDRRKELRYRMGGDLSVREAMGLDPEEFP